MLSRFICLMLLLCAWRVPHAYAQADEAQRTALARSLFDEGLALAHEDKWAEAAERFRRALELKDSSVLSYNLAIALDKLGQVVEASELLLRVVRDPQARADIKTGAQHELEKVQPKIGKLTITVQGERTSGTVSLDDRVLDTAALAVPMPIDPGPHSVVLSDAGVTVQRVEISVPEAGSQHVELTMPHKEVSAPPPTAAEAARALPPSQPSQALVPGPVDQAGTGSVWASPWLWAGVGGAAAAAVVLVLLAGGGTSAAGAATPVSGSLGSGTIVVGGGS